MENFSSIWFSGKQIIVHEINRIGKWVRAILMVTDQLFVVYRGE